MAMVLPSTHLAKVQLLLKMLLLLLQEVLMLLLHYQLL